MMRNATYTVENNELSCRTGKAAADETAFNERTITPLPQNPFEEPDAPKLPEGYYTIEVYYVGQDAKHRDAGDHDRFSKRFKPQDAKVYQSSITGHVAIAIPQYWN
jgi:hypothetical protein